MATFTWTPEFGSSKSSRPRVAVLKFGDGYEARQINGLNANLKVWALQFRNRDVADIDAIEAFLDARVTSTGEHEAFDWTPPRAETAVRVVCREWERSIEKAATDSLSAVFEEVAEP